MGCRMVTGLMPSPRGCGSHGTMQRNPRVRLFQGVSILKKNEGHCGAADQSYIVSWMDWCPGGPRFGFPTCSDFPISPQLSLSLHSLPVSLDWPITIKAKKKNPSRKPYHPDVPTDRGAPNPTTMWLGKHKRMHSNAIGVLTRPYEPDYGSTHTGAHIVGKMRFASLSDQRPRKVDASVMRTQCQAAFASRCALCSGNLLLSLPCFLCAQFIIGHRLIILCTNKMLSFYER